MKILVAIILCSLFATSTLSSQSIYSLNTEWDDEIKQWVIKVDEGEVEGEIEMTWRIRNDMTDWRYRINGQSGTIKQKWDNNPNFWELRSGSTVVSIATIWSGDFTAFRISDGNSELRIERVYRSGDPIEWKVTNVDEELFFWYNEFENDVRDWIVEDYLPDTFSFETKLAAVFVSVLYSI
jgi:hypothetical protein